MACFVCRIDDLSRHTSNSNQSKMSVSSVSNAPYEAVAVATGGGNMRSSSGAGGSGQIATPPGIVHEDPFQRVDKSKGLIITPSKKDRSRNLAQEFVDDAAVSQGSRLDGLLAAAEQLPERAITPVSGQSPVSSLGRKKIVKAKSPGRSQSKEGSLANSIQGAPMIRGGPLSTSGGTLSLFSQVQRGSVSSSQDTTPVSSLLNSEMLQLNLSKQIEKKAVTCNCKKSRCLKM